VVTSLRSVEVSALTLPPGQIHPDSFSIEPKLRSFVDSLKSARAARDPP